MTRFSTRTTRFASFAAALVMTFATVEVITHVALSVDGVQLLVQAATVMLA
jgi:hypothetical protein